MDPNQILIDATEIVRQHAPEVAAIVGAFRFTDIIKAMLGPATNEIASSIQDRVRLYRFGRQLDLLRKSEKMARDAGFMPKAVPIKLLFPLLEGASLEEDEDLHTMWAALLANAADPRFSNRVKVAYAAILRDLTHDDALLLSCFASWIKPTDNKYGPMESTELGMENDIYSIITHRLNFKYPLEEGNARFTVAMENLFRLRTGVAPSGETDS